MTNVPLRINIEQLVVDGSIDLESLRRAIHDELGRLAANDSHGDHTASMGGGVIGDLQVPLRVGAGDVESLGARIGQTIWTSMRGMPVGDGGRAGDDT